jgi:hypothetical protein
MTFQHIVKCCQRQGTLWFRTRAQQLHTHTHTHNNVSSVADTCEVRESYDVVPEDTCMSSGTRGHVEWWGYLTFVGAWCFHLQRLRSTIPEKWRQKAPPKRPLDFLHHKNGCSKLFPESLKLLSSRQGVISQQPCRLGHSLDISCTIH